MYNKLFTSNVLLLILLPVFIGGCGKCYRVTDTKTNAVYYTHDVDRECNGMVEFRNAKTVGAWSFGEKIRLQSAQIERVPNCQCKNEDIVEPCPRCPANKSPCATTPICTPGASNL